MDCSLGDIDNLVIAASDEMKKFTNPFQKIVKGKQRPINPSKELLDLSLGNLEGISIAM